LKKEILPKLKYKDKYIIGGDFNRDPNKEILETSIFSGGPFPKTLKAFSEPSEEQYTQPANRFCDGIVYRGFHQHSLEVDTASYASDHFPIIVTLA
jgi:endonuclease/exonuclease/phosphatase family metal-dependent hydrolase